MTNKPGPPAQQPSPSACHVMAKPSGSVCNLDCTYCFYLEKDRLYPDRAGQWRMTDETLELYIRHYIKAQDVPEVNFAWQGGEPTLMGLDFFRRAMALQQQYADGKTITNAFQTNGILLDDEWGEFLAAHKFLVGLSVDGPRELHDRYRVDKGGKPTFDRVYAGLQTLKRNGVEHNTLTVVQADNADHPLEVYEFLRSEGSGFMQFIPIVERLAQSPGEDGLELIDPTFEGRAHVTRWSVTPLQYGRFLTSIFDTWVRRDVGQVFVQLFDVALGAWVGQEPSLCIFAETCGKALIIESNGDLYSCDHFVYPEYNVGNVHDRSIREMVDSPLQTKFGNDKRDLLPGMCQRCEFRFTCNGGCPKHRFGRTPAGEGGLNYLCKSYKMIFGQMDPYMRVMADLVQRGQPAAQVMEWVREQEQLKAAAAAQQKPGRNDPCPCGSGRKYKQCCARLAQPTAAP
jgi:uncharacterized protein